MDLCHARRRTGELGFVRFRGVDHGADGYGYF